MQLAQACELEAKLAEEYRQVRLLQATIAGEASAHGEHERELGKQAHERINADFNVDDLNTPWRASQKLIAAATLLRAMPTPSTPEARNLHREAQALIEQAAVQQAESSASRIHQQGSAWEDGGAQGQEAFVHAGGAVGQPANQGKTPVRERIIDTRGQAQEGDSRNVINAR
jgi:murein DD-endopeptidase MepM/ murein hydrolase activator NlpD